MGAATLFEISAEREAFLGALYEARLQLIYLDERHPTGTTPSVVARIEHALSTALPWARVAEAVKNAAASEIEQ